MDRKRAVCRIFGRSELDMSSILCSGGFGRREKEISISVSSRIVAVAAKCVAKYVPGAANLALHSSAKNSPTSSPDQGSPGISSSPNCLAFVASETPPKHRHNSHNSAALCLTVSLGSLLERRFLHSKQLLSRQPTLLQLIRLLLASLLMISFCPITGSFRRCSSPSTAPYAH